MAYNDGKVDATVVLVRFDKGYVLATDVSGIDFFIFYDAIEQTGWHTFDELQMGSSVRLRPILHPKGPRGIEVEIISI